MLEILAFELPTAGTPALDVLLEKAGKKTMRVWDMKNGSFLAGWRLGVRIRLVGVVFLVRFVMTDNTAGCST